MGIVSMSVEQVLSTPLRGEQKARLKAVSEMPDEDIDYSDILE